ncbi:MAG: SPOR domain-containing protein [Bacteroidetes bacterium]|nr:SPOR domain-containing protein [Bacteroidota bacterium]
MKRIYFLLFSFCLLLFVSSFAQDTAKSVPETYHYPYPHPFPEKEKKNIDSSKFFMPKLAQPTLGFGPGILTFYGDVGDKHTLAPSLSRLGYHVTFSEQVSRSLTVGARAMFGTLSANERGPRFANFQSSIRMGGLHLEYNFDNFLKKKRSADPFITTGFEYFEFLTKTDLYDASGNKYYFWSDGSIKNMSEEDPNAINAIPLARDYKYETDVRKMNGVLFGKYPERSFAVPVGVGVTLHLTPRWNFKLGATMHFTFTDYIDGITPDNKGVGKGDSKKDNFLETYFTLTFDLFNPKPPYISPLTDAEFAALAIEDTDGDGVIDWNDSCQGTPPGVAVDAKGCPLDSDGDGHPDYVDKEVNSPAGAMVDENGVAMNDSTLARNYRIWSDSTGQYAMYKDTIINPVASAGGGWSKPRESTVVYRRELVVVLGTYSKGVPPDEMGKLLSVPDVKSSMQKDSSTVYTAGNFGRLPDAEKRRDELKGAGFPGAKVMIRNKDGSFSEPTAENLAGLSEVKTTTEVKPDMKGVVYRVQLGAYSKKLSMNVFKNAGPMVEVKTEDGLYKYTSGSFSSVQDAMKHRDELAKKGYKGAFVVAYKDNKRVPVSAASGGIVQPKNETMEEPKTPKSAVDKKLVVFRVQVGAFMNEPPADMQKKFSKLPGLEKKKKSSGVNQYVAGKFGSYEEAKKFRDEVGEKYGIKDAFLVAFFKDEMISVQEAVELLK